MIIIVDFGSQTTHLIKRRLEWLGFEAKIVSSKENLNSILKSDLCRGIILSGGPSSVYEKNAPLIDKKIFDYKIPILGICYGMQLIAYLLDGQVTSHQREYGPQNLNIIDKKSHLFKNIPSKFSVWMSHGDQVVKLPKNFKIIASTEKLKEAAIENDLKKIYGVQFHPEIYHTENGSEILKNFAQNICAIAPKKNIFQIENLIEKIKNEWLNQGKGKIISAVSGGIDSTVATFIVAKALKKEIIPIFVDSGLLREETKNKIKDIFKSVDLKPKIINARKIFLKKLKGVVDPEKKRKIIGKTYIEIFEKEAKKIKNAKFLIQGTIYSDVVESGHSDNKSAVIKSHHNVGGLPKKMKLKLIEPLRYFYKDEVRMIGRFLNLPKEIVDAQPFPGPGFAIRIIGEVNKKRLDLIKKIDEVLNNILKKHNLYEKIFQSFPILTGIKSTAVKGDGRVYGEVIGIRIYESTDIMSASWAKIPYEVLNEIAQEINQKFSQVSRVVYDISTKPPSTMEWE
ncbi:MAG: glutamine-hydrolyzing GMP synthase [Patescibacteria group bacterium]|nr:glutamine-hydrolyzing GMP synthase [Patescibacteria group bacterium]